MSNVFSYTLQNEGSLGTFERIGLYHVSIPENKQNPVFLEVYDSQSDSYITIASSYDAPVKIPVWSDGKIGIRLRKHGNDPITVNFVYFNTL